MNIKDSTNSGGARLSQVPLTAIHPQGFLKEFLRRQTEGLSGHFRSQGYPFDTCLWEGRIAAKFRELDYNGLPVPVPGENRWWPYEQTGYLLDGLLRLGLLTGNEAMVSLFRRNLDWLLAHPVDGRLAGAAYGYDSEWPMGVFFKGVSAYLDALGGDEIVESFRRHYLAVPVDTLAIERNVTNIEGLLEVARRSGDASLREKAFTVYDRFNGLFDPELPWTNLTLGMLEDSPNIVMHGVTFCEEIKLPVLLHLAGGDDRLLRAAERGWRLVMDMHGQIPGMPCSVENSFGRDPNQGYETCVISDSLYTLGFFLMDTRAAAYADQMEKIAFNALPGAVTRDFSALQYLSAPNQVLATPFSQSSSFLRGQAPLRQYRPDHFAACCPGNVHRAMPNYISRMWLRDASDAPSAALFGPSSYEGVWQRRKFEIREETDYPFGEEIRFVWRLPDGPLSMPFTFRVPHWCDAASLSCNGGEPVPLSEKSGRYLTIEQEWHDGDVLRLALPMSTRQFHERQWTWFERGPLVYALPVEHRLVRENPAERFTPLTMEPTSPWNVAVADPSPVREVAVTGGYPLERPPLELEIPARRVEGAFAELEQQRYTPRLPLDCRTGAETLLRLRPMGCMETRLTAFPDGRRRRFLPILSAFTLETADTPPETMDFLAFRALAREIRIDPDGYYDLARFYRKTRHCDAWLQIRFWADQPGAATLAVLLSDGGRGWFNGAPVLEIPPIMEAETMEPLWFPVTVAKGFNHLLLHVVDTIPTHDHRDAWGAKAVLFADDPSRGFGEE